MTRFENWIFQHLESWPLWVVLIGLFVILWFIGETYNLGNP